MAMLDVVNGIPFESIGSLTYRKSDGSIVSNPDRPLIESLDTLPFPARDLLEMSYYTRPSRFISRNFLSGLLIYLQPEAVLTTVIIAQGL